jgi:hypothetical protein
MGDGLNGCPYRRRVVGRPVRRDGCAQALAFGVRGTIELVKPVLNRLPEVIARLQAADLIPPIESVETIGGGVIRVVVIGTVEPEFHARLTAAVGSTRWKLVESEDDRAAGFIFSNQLENAVRPQASES